QPGDGQPQGAAARAAKRQDPPQARRAVPGGEDVRRTAGAQPTVPGVEPLPGIEDADLALLVEGRPLRAQAGEPRVIAHHLDGDLLPAPASAAIGRHRITAPRSPRGSVPASAWR